MAIRVDPRRLSLLKELAATEGLRPGQLVQRWVEERLDAERSGAPVASGAAPGVGAERVQALEASLDSVSRRVDELAARLTEVLSKAPARDAAAPAGDAAAPAGDAAAPAGDAAFLAATTGTDAAAPVRRRPGRPRKNPVPQATVAKRGGRVALHDEISAVIRERGPVTAAELASAIVERGNYRPPRSAKPLDAATVNSRVSNPTYRALFRRSGHQIGLAD